jgi:cellulose synthase (UDP-forming)
MKRMTRRKAGLAAYLVASLAYLVWRVGWSLNPEAPIYSWVFLSLETWALLGSAMFYWIILDRRAPRMKLPAPGLAIDVLICTYNEPVALVRQTARRALAMRYPHETWILDDGRREEMRELAEELGCRYLTREKNEHFKAGNLNNALAHSRGDLVVVLDADHLVRRDFLTSLIGYFRDPDVALVQTPQVYYNADSFQHHFDPERQRLWHEGAVFHHAIQSGMQRWNAAMFTGSGAVVRRSALEAIGGFATGSVTEDVFTSMRMHAAGWRTVYHDEPLGYLLAPESLVQYLTQRLRWGQGAMQILRMENPLRVRGLSFRQRLVYLNAFAGFAQALVHLAFYLAPPLFLLFGLAPIKVGRVVDFAPLFIHIAVDLVMFKLFLGALARPMLAECYKFLNVYIYIKSIAGFFKKGRLKFRVTTKGPDGGASLALLSPQAVILLLNVTATAVGVLHLTSGGYGTVGALGISVGLFFAAAFSLVGGMAFVFAHRRISARADYAVPDDLPARLAGPSGEVAARAVRVSDTDAYLVVGLAVDAAFAPAQPATVRLDLGDGRSPVDLSGTVADVRPTDGGQVVHLSLAPVPIEEADRLFERFADVAMPRMIDRLVEPWSGPRPRLPRLDTPTPFLPMEPNVL